MLIIACYKSIQALSRKKNAIFQGGTVLDCHARKHRKTKENLTKVSVFAYFRLTKHVYFNLNKRCFNKIRTMWGKTLLNHLILSN